MPKKTKPARDMTPAEEIKMLREQYVKEKDPQKKEAIFQKTQKLIAENPDDAARDFVLSMADVLNKFEVLRVQEALEDVLPFVSQAYIAKTYFKRSRSWFSQRLNGNEVFGITCSFDKDEIKTLRLGLKDMRDKLDAAIKNLKDAKSYDQALHDVTSGKLTQENMREYINKHL